jgi:hypothetical protein
MEECDLLILVYGCYTIEKYKQQIETINATWGKKCEMYKNVKILYVLGEEKRDYFNDTELVKYINVVGVNDDYLSASYKQFLGMKYVYENYKAKFIMCIGTDTYLNIPKLLSFISTFDDTECLYIGGHGDERQIGSKKYHFHAGGPGFIITHHTLYKIYDFLPNIMNDWIEVCHSNHTHELISACDVAISYYLQQSHINVSVIKTNDLSFLHCNYIGYPCHQYNINQSTIISCHLMTVDDFYHFTTILNDNNYFV